MPPSDHVKGVPIEERLLRKLELRGSCWCWTGFVDGQGYGRTYWNGRQRFVHRISYLVLVGPIPDGLILDHTCHSDNATTCKGGPTCLHRRCFNPEHLEPCASGVNAKRGVKAAATHCQRGHLITGVYQRAGLGTSQRVCLTCIRERHERGRG